MDFNHNHRPIYLQVADHIGEQLLTGKLKASDPILSAAEQARLLKVSLCTVLSGYHFLRNQHVIESERGKGYRVAAGGRELLLNRWRKRFFEAEVPRIFKNIYLLNIDWKDIEKGFEEFKSKK